MIEFSQLPCAEEAVEYVLGACLVFVSDGAVTEVRASITPEMIHDGRDRKIFEAILTLDDQKVTPDILAVEEYVISRLDPDSKDLEKHSYRARIRDLSLNAASPSQLEYYCQRIIEAHMKREIYNLFTRILSDLSDPDTDPYTYLDMVQSELADLSSTGSIAEVTNVTDRLTTMLENVIKIQGNKQRTIGVPSYTDIDRYTSGWQNGDSIIIAGRASMGKTALLTTMINNLLSHNFNQTIIVFSYEMTAVSLILRLLCMHAKINIKAARSGALRKDEIYRLLKSAGEYGVEAQWNDEKKKLHIISTVESPLEIFDNSRIDVDQMTSICKRFAHKKNIGLIANDYLQLIPPSTRNKRQQNREQEIAHISRQMKALAKDLNVPVISLSQLSRATENHPGNRPQLSDLRESGSIEQDADIVLFTYRPEYYNIPKMRNGKNSEGMAEIIIGKQRNGPVGSVYLRFIKEYAVFVDDAHIDTQGSPSVPSYYEPNELDIDEEEPF